MVVTDAYVARAPGRLCLFGEHQDYLGLPVITLAVSRHVSVHVEPTGGATLHVAMPDVEHARQIALPPPVPYESDRDYLASAVNVLAREGHVLPADGGFEAEIRGTLPINAGMSSSSALVIAWIAALLRRVDAAVDSATVAEYGYLAEVKEFQEAGGMMDHFSAALGGLIYLQTAPVFRPTRLPLPGGHLVVGNSHEKKATVEDLRRVKSSALQGFAELEETMPGFDLETTPRAEVEPHLDSVSSRLQPYVMGNLTNRDTTREARACLAESAGDPATARTVGGLLTRHHVVLRDQLGVSTPKIEAMLAASLDHGAWGGKINGSGFGGTMFVVVPGDRVAAVVAGIEAAGGEAFEVQPSEGVTIA